MSHDVGQQKIIIDADEEITTVIDQLRFVRGNDVALIVPQRAVILQSVMNLKLLAQEAQRMRKKITIITRDNDGIVFAQRAGISTQPFSAEDEMSHASHIYEEQKIQQRGASLVHRAREVEGDLRSQHVQKNIGAQGFFASQQSSPQYISEKKVGGGLVHPDPQYITQKEQQHMMQQYRATAAIEHQSTVQNGYVYQRDTSSQHAPVGQTQQSMRGGFDIGGAQDMRRNKTITKQKNISMMQRDMEDDGYEQRENDGIAQYEKSLAEARVDRMPSQNSLQNNIVSKKYSSAHKLYNNTSRTIGTAHADDVSRHISVREESMRIKNRDMDTATVSSHARLLVKGLVLGAIVLIAVTVCVIVSPKTTMTVTPKNIVIDDVVEITARVDQVSTENDRRIVPARTIERDITFTKSFSATGKGDVNAQKAQGTITIYNTYDDKPQSLVASTRFLAENGTLFRLVKTTTIPGMKNGEPGKVDALVIADKEGVEGNIGPTRFSVPGFDGSPKKEKFYAISEREMKGGGAGGSNVALVSEDDIARAQKEMETESKQYIQEQLNSMIRPESEVLLAEAIVSEITRSESNMSAQTMSDQFMYEIVAHVYAMVFVQDDVTNILAANVNVPDSADANEIDMRLSFDNVQLDRENGMMRFSVHGNADVIATVAVDDFKEDIVGKKHDDLRSVIENRYRNTIEKITIESVFPQTPSFLGEKISRFGFMTHIKIADPEK